MSVRIISREYVNSFAKATENPKPDWLIGNTGDWIKLNMLCEAGVDFAPTQQAPLSLSAERREITLMNGKKWGPDYGFDINRPIKFIYSRTPDGGTTQNFIIDLQITDIFGATMVYEENPNMDLIGAETIPIQSGSFRIHGVLLYDEREMQGVRLKYTNIDNADIQAHSLNSFIDGTQTEAYLSGINANIPGYQNMNLIGLQSGMSVNSVRIRKDIQAAANMASFSFPLFAFNDFGLLPGYKRFSKSQPLNKLTGTNPPYQSATSQPIPIVAIDGGVYVEGNPTTMFIKDAQLADVGIKSFKLNAKTVVLGNSGGGQFRILSLILFKYRDGTDFTYDSRTVLETYNGESAGFGVQHIYDDVVVIDVGLGTSFALGYEYEVAAPMEFGVSNIFVASIFEPFEIKPITGDGGYKKKYNVEINFMLSSFWDSVDDIAARIPPEVVFNAAALSDSVLLQFFPEWNNPNVAVQNDMTETERLGNTGWFEENYNGLPNNFQVTSIKYTDLGGQPINSLSYGSETKVRATIAGVHNLTAIQSVFQYGFIWLPQDETQYKNKNTGFHKNTKINSPSNAVFGLGQNNPFVYNGFSEDGLTRMDVRDVRFTQLNGEVVFEAIFRPTTEFTQYFENVPNDRKYALWVSVADHTLPTNFSDRVNLILDTNVMEYYVPISGVLPGVTNAFIEHPEPSTVVGVPLYAGFLEDDVLARSFFPIKIGDRLNQMIMGYEVENVNTGTTFELDRYSASLQQYITDVFGVQQIDFNGERGFKMESGFNKNWVKILRNPTNDYVPTGPDALRNSASSGYVLYFAAKLRWEYWIAKQPTPPVEFFNPNQELNGFNNNWLSYLRAGQHKVNFFILFDVLSNNVVSRYKNVFEISFDGYDENTAIETTHKYFNSATNVEMIAGTDADTGRPVGMLLSNVDTRIEITYKLLAGTFDLNKVYAVTTIEIDEGAGVYQHRQLSSVAGSEFDNLLIPLAGQTKLKMELIAANMLKTSCLVDHTKLLPAARYKITGRVGCFDNVNGTPIDNGIFENAFELKFE